MIDRPIRGIPAWEAGSSVAIRLIGKAGLVQMLFDLTRLYRVALKACPVVT
jgi:hypothetical protein